MTDDAEAATGGMGGTPEDTPEHAAPEGRGEPGATPVHPDDTTGNTEAGTADLDAWTTRTEREEGLASGGGGVAGADDR